MQKEYRIRDKNHYYCVFSVKDSIYDKEISTYKLAIKYVNHIKKQCFIYSPNKVIVGKYDNQYFPVN